MIKDIKNPKISQKTRNNCLGFGKEINSEEWKQVAVKSVRILAQKGKMAFKTPIVTRELKGLFVKDYLPEVKNISKKT